MNKIILLGNLGGLPEQKTFQQSGTPYWTFSIATNEKYRDKNTQEVKTTTTWHRCQLVGNYQNLIPYLKAGTSVLIEGKQEHILYDEKDQHGNVVMVNGKAKKATMSFVKIQSVQLVGGRQENEQQAPPTPEQYQAIARQILTAQQAPAAQPQQQPQQQYQAPINSDPDLPF